MAFRARLVGFVCVDVVRIRVGICSREFDLRNQRHRFGRKSFFYFSGVFLMEDWKLDEKC